MKLELLLTREKDFWESLNLYVKEHQDAFMHLGLVSKLIKSDFIFDPKLNFICRSDENTDLVASSVLDENYDKNRYRQLLRKFYIALKVSKISLTYLLPKKSLNFCLTPGIIIIPGNNSYRFFNVLEKQFYVFPKVVSNDGNIKSQTFNKDF